MADRDAVELRPLPIVGRSVACPRCGATFPCGAATGHCWCFDLPKLAMPADATDCLCPDCLQAEIDRAKVGSAPPRRPVE